MSQKRDIKNRDVIAAVKGSKAVLFDLFHTLTSVEAAKAPGWSTDKILGVSVKEWHDQLLKYSHERLLGKLRDPHDIIATMAHAINPEIPEDAIIQAVGSRARRFAFSLINIPDKAVLVLKIVKAMEKKTALVSNADCLEIAAWSQSPLKDLFDEVLFSCEVGCMKPDAEIYELAAKRLGVAPPECVFVGDGGSEELRGAREAGMTTVMVTEVIKDIWPETMEERRAHADYVIDGLEQLVRE